MYKLILIRHGQSEWNLSNQFTGWTDVDLTPQGVEEAKRAGRILRDSDLDIRFTYTSFLKRAIKTLNYVLEEMDRMWLPVEKTWRLNEKHYGMLQGQNKKEAVSVYGEEQVRLWRRSYDVPPPALEADDPRYPGSDPRYKNLTAAELPLTECLKDTVERVLPYWNDVICPEIRAGKSLIIAAHGNSLRALIKYLDNVSDEEIIGLNIPTGIPLLYELDENMRPVSHRYLGDEEAAKAAAEAVANQAKKK